MDISFIAVFHGLHQLGLQPRISAMFSSYLCLLSVVPPTYRIPNYLLFGAPTDRVPNCLLSGAPIHGVPNCLLSGAPIYGVPNSLLSGAPINRVPNCLLSGAPIHGFQIFTCPGRPLTGFQITQAMLSQNKKGGGVLIKNLLSWCCPFNFFWKFL